MSGSGGERKVIVTAVFAHILDHVCELAFPAVMVLVSLEFFGRQDSYEQLGMAYSVATFLFGLGAIPAGRLVDWIGTRRMLIVYSFGSAAGLFLVGSAVNFSMLVVSLGLMGLFAGLYHPTGLTFISFGTRRHGRAMGLHGVGGNLGLAVTPFMVGALAELLGWRQAFRVLGIAPLLLGLFVLRGGINVEAEDTSPGPGVEGGSARPYLLLPLVLLFTLSAFNGMCYRGLMTFLPTFFIENVNLDFIRLEGVLKGGSIASLVLVLGMAGQYFGGRLADRVSKEMLYTGVFVFSCPLLFLIPYLKDLGLIICFMVFAFFYFASQPVGNALLPRYTTASFRGRIFGWFFFMNFGVGAAMSWIGGWIGEKWNLEMIFSVLSASLFVAIIMGTGLVLSVRKLKEPV